jgi:hypothetical protein
VLARFPGAEIVDVRKSGEGVEPIARTDAGAAASELRPDDEASV